MKRFTSGFSAILAVVLVTLGIGGVYYLGLQKIKSIIPSSLVPVSTSTPTFSPIVFPTADWKIYHSNKTIKYSFEYPSSFSITPHDLDEGVSLGSITLNCPRGAYTARTNLPDPRTWEPNEGGYTTRYYKEISVNEMNAVQYIWAAPDGTGWLYTALLRNGDPVVCEFMTKIDTSLKDSRKYEDFIRSQTIYSQIISTFKFLD